MKLSKRLLSAVASAVCTLTVCAGSLTLGASAEVFEQLTYKVVNGNAVITDCDSAATNITIPSIIQTYNVTAIDSSAFSDCTALTQVTIPDSVTSIGSNAFNNCSSLKSINIPETITSIGTDAFYGTDVFGSQTGPVYYVGTDTTGKWAVACDSAATAVKFDDATVGIADSAFRNSSLQSVTIPSKTKTIGLGAFISNKSLRSVVIPSSVKTIESKAFQNCNAMLSVEIGPNVESIGDSAFENCEKLSNIKIPASVKNIGSRAFNATSDYQNQEGPELYIDTWVVDCLDSDKNISLNIKNGTKGIADDAFQDKEFVIAATIPEGVTTIGNSAFSGCTKLAQLTIPDSLTTINDYAFYRTAIPSITLSKNVAKIGQSAFSGCNNLETITILNPTCDIFDGTYTIDPGAKMFVTENSTAYDYAIKYGRKYDFTSAVEYYTGDVNYSGGPDFLDLVLIAKHLAGTQKLTAEQIKIGDVTQSGDIDFLDLVRVSRMLIEAIK